MRTLLNIVWLVLSGLWLAIGYAVAGILMCLLVITIPFGIQSFKLVWPFGREIVSASEVQVVRASVRTHA